MTDDITPEWLQEIGFELGEIFVDPRAKRFTLHSDGAVCVTAHQTVYGGFDSWSLYNYHFPIPAKANPKTRAEVLRLCAAMGHQVKGGGE